MKERREKNMVIITHLLPIITTVDKPGGSESIDSFEHGQ